jgi:hypothetical protein
MQPDRDMASCTNESEPPHHIEATRTLFLSVRERTLSLKQIGCSDRVSCRILLNCKLLQFSAEDY